MRIDRSDIATAAILHWGIERDGMGFAKAAELNHYPGPKHVLQLADQLQLSNEQRTRTETIFQKMNA